MHENINIYKTTKFCVLCGLLLFMVCILNKLVVPVHEILNNALMHLHLFFVNFPGPPSHLNMRLDSEQLVSEFLQGALSNKMS